MGLTSTVCVADLRSCEETTTVKAYCTLTDITSAGMVITDVEPVALGNPHGRPKFKSLAIRQDH